MTSHDSAGAPLPPSAVRELAAAMSGLLGDHDVIGAITDLLSGCADSVRAGAAGIVMSRPDGGRPEFLAATDHRSEHLELYQVQLEQGPALDCLGTGRYVAATDLDEVGSRWPTLREPFRRAGFAGIHAVPMLWQGRPLGALNLFFTEQGPGADAELVARTFADLATLIILHAQPLPRAEVATRTRAALEARAVIERAKGVLSQTLDLPMENAFDRLVVLAHDQQQTLTDAAATVVEQAANGDHRGR